MSKKKRIMYRQPDHYGKYSYRKDYLGGGGPGYRKSTGKKILKAVLFILALGAALIAGYFLVVFLSNTPITKSSSSKPTSEASTAPVSTESTTQEPTTEPPVIDTRPKSVKAVWLPSSVLDNPASLDSFIEKAKAAGVNSVVFELKRQDGTLAYESHVETAVTIKSVYKPMKNLTEAISKLKAADLLPVARIYCFRDPFASNMIRTSAIYYKDTQRLWLDKAKTEGGKPWLNPYSSDAHTYLINIVSEVAGLGIQNIMLDGVQFPGGNLLSSATYPGAGTLSQMDALAYFVSRVKESAGANVNIMVAMTGMGAVSGDMTLYGGNPMDFGAGICCPDFRIASFPKGADIGGTVFQKPASDPINIIKAASSSIFSRSLLGDRDVKLMPWLLCDRSTEDTLTGQIGEIKNAGMDSYILYNENGNYDFTKFQLR